MRSRSFVVSSAFLLLSVVPAAAQVTTATYARAEQLLPKNADRLVLHDKIQPHWLPPSDRFWYRVDTERGVEFMLVDPAKGTRAPLFDRARLAPALGAAADTALAADSLPFQALEWREDGKSTALVVSLRGKSWRCDLGTYRCESAGAPKASNPNELVSPNGRWALSQESHNLWIRNTETGARRQLTTDGIARFDYATSPESNTSWVTGQRRGFPSPPIALWSPDSKSVLTTKLDQRRVPESYLVQAVPEKGGRPQLWSFAFPMPGDSVATGTWWLFDPESGQGSAVDAPALAVPFQTPISFQQVWWADSTSATAYYLDIARGVHSYDLRAIDVATRRTRTVATERGPTLVEATLSLGAKPNVYVTKGGREVVWFSQRDGFAHLYLLDGASGQVKNPITQGSFVVRRLIAVDEAARRLWFTAGGREPGRDPYYEHLYSINFDGSGLSLLSPEDAHHEITVSPSQRWVVDRFSRADLAPTTVLRSLDGKTVLPLEKADVSRLLATGWRWPERFKVTAEDGTTELYGLIYRPSTFDSTKRYPVIEEIYPGPQTTKVPKPFEAGSDHRALVELGMIGFEIDGRGTPFRSKAFHNFSYGHLENGGGVADHVAALRQLAASRPYLDLDRVGIYGHSGGGFASARAMFLFPDFYQVAVSSAGNHDQRGYLSLWGETYQGMPQGDNYGAQANPSIASHLKGRLMLVFGDMDDNVPPALTIQVIDALTKANKNYDLMIVPNGSHAMLLNPYFRRRRWDYFVEHLMGGRPPEGYEIKTPPELNF